MNLYITNSKTSVSGNLETGTITTHKAMVKVSDIRYIYTNNDFMGNFYVIAMLNDDTTLTLAVLDNEKDQAEVVYSVSIMYDSIKLEQEKAMNELISETIKGV